MLTGLTSGTLGFVFTKNPSKRTRKLDLDRAEDNLLAFVKMRASLDGIDTVFWWTGGIHSTIPGEQGKKLFGFEGYNIAKAVKIEGVYQLLTREMSVYKNPESGEILKTWINPFTLQTVRVVPVWNDPVNSEFLLNGERTRFPLRYTLLGKRICWTIDVFLTYPSLLPRSQYPRYSQSDLYQGAELFQFYAARDDLEDQAVASAPTQISWTRIGSGLPWMKMADRPGNLVYHCTGHKVNHGFDGLPVQLREFVNTHHSRYRTAPESFTRPNETSWTYFKKILE